MADIQEYTFEIYRGDDTTFVLDVKDADGNDIDFSGSVITMLIDFKTEQVLLKEGYGIEIVNNKLNIIFSHDLTKEWLFRNGKYDLQMVDSKGKYKTILKGTVEITRDITP